MAAGPQREPINLSCQAVPQSSSPASARCISSPVLSPSGKEKLLDRYKQLPQWADSLKFASEHAPVQKLPFGLPAWATWKQAAVLKQGARVTHASQGYSATQATNIGCFKLANKSLQSS